MTEGLEVTDRRDSYAEGSGSIRDHEDGGAVTRQAEFWG